MFKSLVLTTFFWLSVNALTLQNMGLTSVPDNLPDNITEIDLSRNLITKIDAFPFYPDLEEVALNHNQLETFPNVSSIGLTLQVLDCSRIRFPTLMDTY